MAEPLQKSSDQFSVLIVDDDLTILSLLKEIVSMVPGCEVLTAENAEQAMQQMVSGQVDVVFSDIHMPGASGIEMIQDMLALERTPEIIIMTGYPTGEVAAEAMDLGASSLLAKPFEDISVVELELDKAIKKVLRQRRTERSEKLPSVEKKPAEPMAVRVSAEEYTTPYGPKVFHKDVLQPFVEVEMRRCQRYHRQFAVGIVDLPENLEARTRDERRAFREQQMNDLLSCFRTSDVVIDAEKDGAAILGFECNRPGCNVMEFKLARAGFQHYGFSIFPSDGETFDALYRKASERLQDKRKYRIGFLEPDEIFGGIVQNMLADPKYNVEWLRDFESATNYAEQHTDNIRVFAMSLSKDPKMWEMLAKWKQQALVQWPIILFTEVVLNDRIKQKLQQLGVKALVKKGASQDEVLYVFQSFIMQPSVSVIRKNPRALITLPVVYSFEGKEVQSNTFTLSREGVFITDLNPPPTGSKLELKLLVPGLKEPLQFQCEVIYTVPYFVGVSRIHVAGMALRFLEVSEKCRRVLDQLVSRSLTSYLIDPGQG